MIKIQKKYLDYVINGGLNNFLENYLKYTEQILK